MFFRDVPCLLKAKIPLLLLSLKLRNKIVSGTTLSLDGRPAYHFCHSHWAGTTSSLWFALRWGREMLRCQRRCLGQALHLLVTNCHQEVLCASNRLCIQRTSSPSLPNAERPRSKMLRDTGQESRLLMPQFPSTSFTTWATITFLILKFHQLKMVPAPAIINIFRGLNEENILDNRAIVENFQMV